MSRKKILLSLFNITGLGLEIGPGFDPLLPKKNGYNVETLDHLNADELVKKYQNAAGVDVSKIEKVDYVSRGGSIFEAVGVEGRFDFIIASHVIEHTVDFIGFIKDCERLLKHEGFLVLAVPDKRFSFDVLRPLTSTGDVLQSHLDKRNRHTPGAIFDEVAYNSILDGKLAWTASQRGKLDFFFPLQEAKSIFEATQHDELFRDIHAWQFTPSSFRLIVNDLFEIGYISSRESDFKEEGGDFFVVLSKNGTGPQMSRMSLARRVIAEQCSIRVGSS